MLAWIDSLVSQPHSIVLLSGKLECNAMEEQMLHQTLGEVKAKEQKLIDLFIIYFLNCFFVKIYTFIHCDFSFLFFI